MNVDTAEFRNLAAQVAELADQIQQLRAKEFSMEHSFAAGVALGEERARGALLGKAARTSGPARPARTAGPRPGHLRVMDGGTS